ncbi:MAG: 50S ribosomal L9 C-terminal domain-containing protein, partial [Bacteroidota bacterium]
MISKNQIKYIQALHLKKNRDSQGLFIVEGIKSVSEFVSDDAVIVKDIFATSDYLKQYQAVLEKKNIALVHPIKDLGIHNIPLKLKEGVLVSLKLNICGDRV